MKGDVDLRELAGQIRVMTRKQTSEALPDGRTSELENVR